MVKCLTHTMLPPFWNTEKSNKFKDNMILSGIDFDHLDLPDRPVVFPFDRFRFLKIARSSE